MKDKLECKIIQDYLIPSYLDNLTDEDTKKYIEEHIKNCDECRNAYENMKIGEENEKEKRNKNGLNYFKKFNKKFKALKIIIFSILLIVFLVFSISTGRKMIIISKLSQKAQRYENKTNYHMTYCYYYNNGDYRKTEDFVLDNKLKYIEVGARNNEEPYTVFGYGTKYEDEEKYNMHDYSELNGESIVVTDGILYGMPRCDNILPDNNLWEIFKCSLNAKIKATKMGGKECYRIDNLKTSKSNFTHYECYFDKETGLLVYQVNPNEFEAEAVKYMYEFDTVKEEDFIEPDWSTYKILTIREYIKYFEEKLTENNAD